MGNILDEIIAKKRIEIESRRSEIPLRELEIMIDFSHSGRFKEALEYSETGIIAEFKRRSPSRDWIFKEAKVDEVIPQYAEAGAAAISVLTDYPFFGGSIEDFRQARTLVSTPLLRKDFMVSEYQIFEAKVLAADAVLLIAAALTKAETLSLAKLAKSLQLDTLLEVHNEKELDYLNEFIDVVGVNNRDLKRFITDVDISRDLAQAIPNEFLKISESGLSSAETLKELRNLGYRGFLMGETFMKEANPGLALTQLIKELC